MLEQSIYIHLLSWSDYSLDSFWLICSKRGSELTDYSICKYLQSEESICNLFFIKKSVLRLHKMRCSVLKWNKSICVVANELLIEHNSITISLIFLWIWVLLLVKFQIYLLSSRLCALCIITQYFAPSLPFPYIVFYVQIILYICYKWCILW